MGNFGFRNIKVLDWCFWSIPLVLDGKWVFIGSPGFGHLPLSKGTQDILQGRKRLESLSSIWSHALVTGKVEAGSAAFREAETAFGFQQCCSCFLSNVTACFCLWQRWKWMERIPQTLLGFLHGCTPSVCYPSVQISKLLCMVAQKGRANPIWGLGSFSQGQEKKDFPFLRAQGCVTVWLLRRLMHFHTLAHITFK